LPASRARRSPAGASPRLVQQSILLRRYGVYDLNRSRPAVAYSFVLSQWESGMESGLILVVDDDLPTRRVLNTVLYEFGLKTVDAGRGEEALSLVCATPFDAVLLDIEMPGMSGIDTCRNMRRLIPHTPILMLSVRDTEDDKVEALDAGADDYITKPFRLRELAARIHAAMRWAKTRTPRQHAPASVLRVGEIELDPVHHTARKADRFVHLTPKEFKLTYCLMASAGRPVPHSMLLDCVWGPGHRQEVDYLRTFVYQLRKKLEDDPANPRYLLTDSSIGYRFMSRS
jgi:two-component system KDP operon response regulator KdpE